MEQPVIEVTNLCKQFKDFKAVNNLNFTVYNGDVCGFLGPNGAGKSTTIRMLMGLIYPTSGSIKIFRKDIEQHKNEILANTGAIIEKPDFYGYLTARENLNLLNKLSLVEVSENRIDEVLQLVGLKERENSKVKTFSQGMKQRLGFAQALMHNPQLIVLDEPTNGLDPQGVKDVRNLILHLSKDLKKTILISSHILSEIEIICNRMVIIQNGAKVVEGTVNDLLNYSELKVTFEFENNDNVITFIEQNLILKEAFKEVINHKFHFVLNKNKVALVNELFINNGFKVTAVIPVRSLEDYFLNTI